MLNVHGCIQTINGGKPLHSFMKILEGAGQEIGKTNFPISTKLLRYLFSEKILFQKIGEFSNINLNMICTGAEVGWNLIDSDHAGVKLWLDVRKITKRGPGLFKVNGSLLENPINLQNAQVHDKVVKSATPGKVQSYSK